MFVSPYVLALCVPVTLVAAFAVETWRRCDGPGVGALRLLLLSVGLWAGGTALTLLAPDRATWVTFEQVAWTGRIGVPVAWVLFALRYTGYGDRVTRRSTAALALPGAVMLALVWSNPIHGLVWSDVRLVHAAGVAVGLQTQGPAYWAFTVYAYTLVIAGLVPIMRLVFTADHLFVDQGVALMLGVCAPLLANVATVTGVVPIRGLDMTPYMFTISAVTYGYALYRSDLLDRVPATRQIGRTAVVRNMRDGVVVVDEDDVIVEVNPTAREQFDISTDGAVGRPVRAVFDDPEFELPVGEGTVVWSRGPFEYEVKVSELSDQHGRQLGRVLVLRDITDRTNRRQQLQVLDRVLRHNFRNDMNVIDVCATQLVERLDGENEELAGRIRSVARDLSETGTKAREIERIMSRRHNDPQPIDLPSLVTRQLDTLRHEYPAAEIEADLPDELEIRSTGILESVLQNVLENAVVHNDGQQPHVWVRVDTDDSGNVEIAVADDGPGIPQQEREVLIKGTETPLEHGSGLGLWLVNWGVTMLGGEIEFRDRVAFGDEDVRGSVVTITIPRQGPTVHATSDQPSIDAD
ncbi:MAG: histidine kinase N-terminal 7TM domain-containing protein [Halorientalis sp.]